MDQNPPAYIGRTFNQICFAVPDLDRAIDYWTNVNGVSNWAIQIGLSNGQTEKEYQGGPGNFEFSCAFGFAGDILIELARPDGGESGYQDWVDQGSPGPHHIGFLLGDVDEYDRAVDIYAQAGRTKAMAGFYQGSSMDCRWSYWDTRADIGCYTELYYVTGDGEERLRRLKAGEDVSIAA
jgi:catechol 2,3-dioxygenase-like lactoylglutathione lyase family enzyme